MWMFQEWSESKYQIMETIWMVFLDKFYSMDLCQIPDTDSIETHYYK